MIQAALKIVTKPVLIRRARLVQIASSDPPKKAPFSFRSPSFCFEIQGLLLTHRKVSLKKNLCFLVKLSTENRYLWVNIFYFCELQLSMKISKEIS